jgi:hypothetical protein
MTGLRQSPREYNRYVGLFALAREIESIQPQLADLRTPLDPIGAQLRKRQKP